jgi:hypothetical protein
VRSPSRTPTRSLSRSPPSHRPLHSLAAAALPLAVAAPTGTQLALALPLAFKLPVTPGRTSTVLFPSVPFLCRSVDFARSSGMGMGKQVKLFVSVLTKASSNRGSAIFTTAELERFAKDTKLSVPSFSDFLEVCTRVLLSPCRAQSRVMPNHNSKCGTRFCTILHS